MADNGSQTRQNSQFNKSHTSKSYRQEANSPEKTIEIMRKIEKY